MAHHGGRGRTPLLMNRSSRLRIFGAKPTNPMMGRRYGVGLE